MSEEAKESTLCLGEYFTNEEYREKLKDIFDGIDENYILKYFYNFITAKLESESGKK